MKHIVSRRLYTCRFWKASAVPVIKNVQLSNAGNHESEAKAPNCIWSSEPADMRAGKCIDKWRLAASSPWAMRPLTFMCVHWTLLKVWFIARSHYGQKRVHISLGLDSDWSKVTIREYGVDTWSTVGERTGNRVWCLKYGRGVLGPGHQQAGGPVALFLISWVRLISVWSCRRTTAVL